MELFAGIVLLAIIFVALYKGSRHTHHDSGHMGTNVDALVGESPRHADLDSNCGNSGSSDCDSGGND